MSEQIELYHYWRSSCSWRVRWALNYKEISYQASPINLLKNEQSSPSYLRLNPAGAVPCLRIGNLVLCESLAIIEYLEQRWPEKALLPVDPVDVARVRQLSLSIVAATQPLQNLSVMQRYSGNEQERADWARYWIGKGLNVFATIARQWGPLNRYAYGSSLSLADLCLVPQINNARRFAVDLSGLDDLVAIYDHCMTLPACLNASPDKLQP